MYKKTLFVYGKMLVRSFLLFFMLLMAFIFKFFPLFSRWFSFFCFVNLHLMMKIYEKEKINLLETEWLKNKQTLTHTQSFHVFSLQTIFNESKPQIYSNKEFMDHKAPKASFCGVKKKFPTTKQKFWSF